MLQQLASGGWVRHLTRQLVPSRSGSIRKEPPRGRQADPGQLEYSRARGGGTCQALGHRATWAKHRLQSTGRRGNVQSAIHVGCVTPRDHLPHIRPAERSEGGADVIILAEARDQPYRKVYDPLQSVQTGVGSTTPDWRAVLKVGENVGLDKGCKDFRWEVVTNFEDWYKDCVVSPNTREYICASQLRVWSRRTPSTLIFFTGRLSRYIIHSEGKARCPINIILSTEKCKTGFACVHL